MADFDKEKDNIATDGIPTDIDSLTKKYGISLDGDTSAASKYSPASHAVPYNPPRNNSPARTPRIVYDANDPASGVRIVYGTDEPKGPEGRRVVYQVNEEDTIAAKRRRNAQIQRTQKGSQGFGSQPYVQHVASSDKAMELDDETKFTKAYSEKKENHDEAVPVNATPLTKSKGKLVSETADTKDKNVHVHYEKTGKEKVRDFFKAFIPWKGDPAKEIVRKIIMNVSAILVLVCFGYFINDYIQHQEELEKLNEMKNNQVEVETTDDLAAQWAAIYAKYPDVDFPEGMNIRWAELYAKNQDLIGWIKIDNTNIDSAVMHTPSDRDHNGEDYYLRRNFYKNSDKYGTPYLEKYCQGKVLDRNNTIYGHNMKDGLSFAQLEKYYTIEGFKESPIIQYSTLYEDYYFKVYAVFITNGYPSGDNGYLFNYNAANFSSDETFEKYIEALDERKLYDTGVDANADDIFITLSTCSYEIEKTDMGRLAVVGRLVREGESLTVDTSLAKENENIRYPQIWYDEHNMSNPYKNAYQWVP